MTLSSFHRFTHLSCPPPSQPFSIIIFSSVSFSEIFPPSFLPSSSQAPSIALFTHLIAILFLSSDFLRGHFTSSVFSDWFYCFFYLYIQRYHNYIGYDDLDKQKHSIHIALLYLSFFSYLTMSFAFLPSSFLGNCSSFLSSDFPHSMSIVPLLRSLFLAEIYNTSCSSSNKKVMTCYILSIYREVLSINDRYKFYLVKRTFIIFSLHHAEKQVFIQLNTAARHRNFAHFIR